MGVHNPVLPFSRALIIGSGLIGTSIGLALKQLGISIEMRDQDPRAQAIARELTGYAPGAEAELAISAVPISAFPSVLSALKEEGFSGTFIDVASIKTNSLLEVESSGLPAENFLPTHPMAGREVGGAESARADLFEGRAWVIDSSKASAKALEDVTALIAALGAQLVDMAVREHDSAVALVSHLPQILSSLLAKQLNDSPDNWLELAGGGLRDTTRIAASDPELWKEIIAGNSESIAPLLKKVLIDLEELISNIEDADHLKEFLTAGQRGKSRIPGKHGGKAREYTYLPIIIQDKPGQLAAIFQECATAGVNIEDLTIEHSPGQETGLITLALSDKDAITLSQHLSTAGWSVHTPRR